MEKPKNDSEKCKDCKNRIKGYDSEYCSRCLALWYIENDVSDDFPSGDFQTYQVEEY